MRNIVNEWEKYRDTFPVDTIKDDDMSLKKLEEDKVYITKAFEGLIAFEKRKMVYADELFGDHFGEGIVNFFKDIFKTYIKKFEVYKGKKVWFTHFDFVPKEVEIINVTDIGKSFVISIKTEYYNIDNLIFPKTKKGLCKSVTTDEKCGIFEFESDADEYFKRLSL